MADTKYTLPQALHKLTVSLKEKLTKFEADVSEMRARELAPKEGKLAKHELCPLCGGADRNGICNCLRKNAVMGYPNSQGDASMTKHSSSAAALAPAAPRPQTSVAQANKELGGFKSIANSPTGPGRTVAPMSSKKFNIGAAGRGNPATASASGMIGKAEKNMGSARSPYGTGAAGHASTKNMPSALRANINQNTNHSGDERMKKDEMSTRYQDKVGVGIKGGKNPPPPQSGKKGQDLATLPQSMAGPLNSRMDARTQKGEKEMAATPAVPEKKVDGAKMPKKGTDETPSKQGSGGEIKGNKLSKAAPALAARAPEGAGVGGKQPVGQGGGDAHKTAASAGPGGPKNIPKPNVRPGLKSPAAPGQPGGIDVDVSDFDKGPAKPTAKFGALTSAGRGEVKRMIADKGPAGNPNAPQQPMKQMVHPNVERDRLNADKRAGGVGFLNALIRKFRPLAPAQGQQGSLTSQRFHGTTALRRSEKPSDKNPALKEAGKKEAGRLYWEKLKADSANLKKASDMGNCAVCKKAESKCLCKGLSGVNHNRTMLKVSTKRSAKKSR